MKSPGGLSRPPTEGDLNGPTSYIPAASVSKYLKEYQEGVEKTSSTICHSGESPSSFESYCVPETPPQGKDFTLIKLDDREALCLKTISIVRETQKTSEVYDLYRLLKDDFQCMCEDIAAICHQLAEYNLVRINHIPLHATYVNLTPAGITYLKEIGVAACNAIIKEIVERNEKLVEDIDSIQGGLENESQELSDLIDKSPPYVEFLWESLNDLEWAIDRLKRYLTTIENDEDMDEENV